MSTITEPVQAFRYFVEDPDNPNRLGRHQVHDALLPELEAEVDHLEPIVDVEHAEIQEAFDQGDVGDCTMNAAYGTLVCEPFAEPGRTFTQDTIVSGYELETRLDDSQIPGHYPPTDTGSTGAWSMTVLVHLGLIAAWRHTRSLATALRMLLKGPISLGIPWYKSMFTPDGQNVIHVNLASGLAGGHQVCVVGIDVRRKMIKIRNSWGTGWGDNGHCWLSWSDLGLLLKLGGDVVQPVMAKASR